MVKVFPYLLIRYASLPYKNMEIFDLPDFSVWLADRQHLDDLIVVQKEKICADLFISIEQEQDLSLRNKMLNLKRAVHNERKTIVKLLDSLDSFLSRDQVREILALVISLQERSRLLQQWKDVFDRQVVKGRAALQALCVNEDLRRGLLLSSSTLFEQLDKFGACPPGEFKIKEMRMQFSMLRYITRMAFKTSPFSRFTYIGLASLDEDEEAKANDGAVLSHVRLNNKILREIKNIVWYHPVLNEFLEVRPNETIRRIDGDLNFLVNQYNIDAYQTIAANELHLIILSLLENSSSVLHFGELVTQLTERVDATPDSLKVYLLRLYELGFLEFAITNCSELDPDWPSHLKSFAHDRLETDDFKRIYQLINELLEFKQRFETASSKDRAIDLRHIVDHTNTTLASLREAAGFPDWSPSELREHVDRSLDNALTSKSFARVPFLYSLLRKENFIYEDCFSKEITTESTERWTDFASKFQEIATLARSADLYSKKMLEALENTFATYFEKENEVPLLAFYQAFVINEQGRNQESFRADIEHVDKSALFANSRLENGEIHLDRVASHSADLEDNSRYSDSRSAFVQLAVTNLGTMAVLNRMLFGMGKISGRFLHLFDDDVVLSQREWNSRLGDAELINMEINDNSEFNANLHPLLVDAELRTPGAHNRAGQEAQISIADIAIRRSGDGISLVHQPTGKQIEAYDLSLESVFNRSGLYRFLAHFNRLDRISLSPLIDMLDKQMQPSQNNRVIILPRIVYGGNIVLRRQSWVVEMSAFPQKNQEESDAIYFLRLLSWLKEQQMPQQLFLYLRRNFSINNTDDRSKRDDYKPQYIDFAQPLLLQLFTKLLQRASDRLYFEEALPNASTQAGGINSPVKEYLVQWYS